MPQTSVFQPVAGAEDPADDGQTDQQKAQGRGQAGPDADIA
jgi:hypothetical protein